MTTETQGAAEAAAEDTSAALVVEDAPNEAPAAEFEGEDEPVAEDVPEAEKPKKTAKERIAELTWQLRETERREAALKAAAEKPSPKPAEDAAPKASAEDAKPDPNDFEFGVTDEAYIEALADWKVDQRFKERDTVQSERQAIQTAISTFQAKEKELFPDGEPEGLKAYKALPDAGSHILQRMVIDSDVGPKLAEHLGNNQAEITRISGLSPLLQAREIGRLEAGFTAAAKTPAKTVSDAPPPPAGQVRGQGGKFTVAPDTDDFASFEKAYEVQR